MNKILSFKLRSDQLENDLTSSIIFKYRHKAIGMSLDNDLLITLFM